MLKRSAILLVIPLAFVLMLKFPCLSSEAGARMVRLAAMPPPIPQLQFKNPFVRIEGRFRPNRRFSSSQDLHWICAYGTDQSDFLYTIQQTSDGGYIATGMSYAPDVMSTDAVLIKINEEGVLEWQKTYGGKGRDAVYYCSVVETSDDCYLLATDSGDPDASLNYPESDILILKLSSDGSILWQKTYGREDASEYSQGSVQQTRDGGYILAATIVPSVTVLQSVLVLKLDPNGTILWDKIFKTFGMQMGDAVQQTPDGGYIVGCGVRGYPQLSSQDMHPLIIKLDSNGNIRWQKLYEGAGRSSFYRTNLITTQDNGYVVADSVETVTRDASGEKYNGDLWVFKLDSAGNILWQNLYGESGLDHNYALYEARDGGYLVGGYTESYGGEKGWILKLNSAGKITWQKAYGKENTPNLLFSFFQNSIGDFLAAGYLIRSGQSDMIFLNISEAGEIGESYDWVTDTDTIPTPTFTVPINTELVSMNAGLISKFSNASSADFNLTREMLCWNLHQPPINVSIRTETNRSLYIKEFYNFLSWEPNPLNGNFNIAEYRIYKKLPGKQFELLMGVPANTFEYMDLVLRTGELFEYAITSVDSQGRESPRSTSVSIS